MPWPIFKFPEPQNLQLATKARPGAFLSKFNDLGKTCKTVAHLVLESKEGREEQDGPKEENKHQTSFCTLFQNRLHQKPETKRKYILKK